AFARMSDFEHARELARSVLRLAQSSRQAERRLVTEQRDGAGCRREIQRAPRSERERAVAFFQLFGPARARAIAMEIEQNAQRADRAVEMKRRVSARSAVEADLQLVSGGEAHAAQRVAGKIDPFEMFGKVSQPRHHELPKQQPLQRIADHLSETRHAAIIVAPPWRARSSAAPSRYLTEVFGR